MPKYKSPDGRVFCSMQEAKFDFCATHKCFDCALEKHANEQGESCGYYADCHPDEAARMMGSGKAARVLYSAIMLTVQDQQSYAAGQHGCPTCGWFVGEQFIPSFAKHKPHNQKKCNFCSQCGQRIDWQGVETEGENSNNL